MLRPAQPFDDPVAQQLFDERHAARTDRGCLLEAPVAVVGKELARLGR